MTLFEAPEDETAQAAVYAIATTGTITQERTINLQSVQEKMQVLQKAPQLAQSYQPPSG